MTTNLERMPGYAGRAIWRSARVAFVISALLLSLSASAGEKEKKKAPDYALIFGTVWSADNRPYAGAKVYIRRSDEKKARWLLYSDRRGEFAQRVPVGKADYVVWAEVPKKKGHAAETTAHIEDNERTDIGLHLKE